MMPGSRVLHQFPISHYCEKARWTLDAKGLSYRVNDVVPGRHVALARRLGVARGVPILVDGERAVADSTEIALHVERTYGGPPLLPSDEAARAKVLELEDYFDEAAGRDVRRWLYGVLMQTRGDAARALFGMYPLPVRLFGRLVAPRIESTLRSLYRIDSDTMRASRAGILEAVERIERVTGGDAGRYLVGDALTIADITAASIVAPVLCPSGSPWDAMPEAPPEIAELRDEVSARAGGQWVLRRYRDDRRRIAS